MNRADTPPHPDHDLPAPTTLLLSFAERAELQRQGAKAAARGEPADTSPLRQPRNRPAATGESADTWLQRSAAWQQGHDAQTAARGQVPPPTSPGDTVEHD